MKSCYLCLCLLSLGALLMSACETTRGPGPDTMTFMPVNDVIQGAEYEHGSGPLAADARHIRLRPGQILAVFRGYAAPGDDQRELAFYLPVEARSVVQLVVETNGFTKTYFLRAISPGDTVGGVVERRWLDGDGYNPRDAAAETRVRNAVRSAPFFISVY